MYICSLFILKNLCYSYFLKVSLNSSIFVKFCKTNYECGNEESTSYIVFLDYLFPQFKNSMHIRNVLSSADQLCVADQFMKQCQTIENLEHSSVCVDLCIF